MVGRREGFFRLVRRSVTWISKADASGWRCRAWGCTPSHPWEGDGPPPAQACGRAQRPVPCRWERVEAPERSRLSGLGGTGRGRATSLEATTAASAAIWKALAAAGGRVSLAYDNRDR